MGGTAAKNREIEHLLLKCTIFMEKILWKKAHFLVHCFQTYYLKRNYVTRLTRSLSVALQWTLSKSEKVVHQYEMKDNGKVSNLEENSKSDDLIVCFKCKRKLHFSYQLRLMCKQATTCFCLNYRRSVRKTCNIIGQCAMILCCYSRSVRRFVMVELRKRAQDKKMDEEKTLLGGTKKSRLQKKAQEMTQAQRSTRTREKGCLALLTCSNCVLVLHKKCTYQ